MSKCEFEHDTWGPNAGCSEFMTKPEMWRCTAEATTTVLDEFLDEACLWHLCTEHAEALLATEPESTRVVA